MELAIDTSTRYAGIALAREGQTLLEITWHSRQNHTVELMPTVEHALKRLGLTARDLKAIVVARGPGGFSALRVGISAAKGLAASLELPIVAVDTLEVEAYPYCHVGLPVCPVLQISKTDVAWALFVQRNSEWRKLQEEQVGTPEALLRQLQEPVLMCGEGVQAVAQHLGSSGLGHLVMRVPSPTRRPSILAFLGHERLAGGQVEDVASLQPLYLRPPSITLGGGARS
ncbi:MAG: tRNA (adenosine(37)-N6)-threonylcarbamoyltransferase complex dimerization subunit type 1 TsaB [Chloroflexi bacterium]|nr:tRNA (adenosine(37)-N6)-threonylcarbamoyltransferase complex dimerization subunit type 1 TsaB [Chloroflexota bacterium]